jgi:hypothetical protein
VWRDNTVELDWFLDVDGDGTEDVTVAYYNDGGAVVADVMRAADGAKLCSAQAAFEAYDSLRSVWPTYLARIPASCIGSPSSFALAAWMGYDDGSVSSEEFAPSTGFGASVPQTAARAGYWMLGDDGTVYGFGDATVFPGPARTPPTGPPSPGCSGSIGPAVDIEPTPTHRGYWIIDRWGNLRTCGDASGVFQGKITLNPGEEVVSLSAVPDYEAINFDYWVFTNSGRVIPINGAPTFGDMTGVKLNGGVLDSVATPSGKGYYMVATDGGIFAFGDAKFYGSMGDTRLNAPVQSLVPDPDGIGYWLVASDGGVFAFDAPYRGSMGTTKLNKPITGMVAFGNGYLMVGEDGGIFNFSDKAFYGSLGSNPPAHPITTVAALDES